MLSVGRMGTNADNSVGRGGTACDRCSPPFTLARDWGVSGSALFNVSYANALLQLAFA